MTVASRSAPSAALSLAVCSPYDGSCLGQVPLTPASDAEGIVTRAMLAAGPAARMPRHLRAGILERAAQQLQAEAEDFARLITAEAGKTLTQARKEVSRCINTLRLSAAEARRNAGEVIPFDAYEGSENRRGWFSREPLGVILAITPYNDPLNLVAHKLGPAIAGGNAVILKPSELAPLSALKLLGCLRHAGLPASQVQAVIGGADLGAALVADRRIRMVSFTGGFSTGETIARGAGLKKLAMELGGNAPVIVMEDCDFGQAIDECLSGAFWAAGQNCIGVQRILIARPLYARFRAAFIERAARLKAGDPADPASDVGPMITQDAAMRAEARVNEALALGATLLCGNRRRGPVFEPTVLENVPPAAALWNDEIFAPVVMLAPFDTIGEAITRANDCDYALHAAIFTRDLTTAMQAAGALEAGGVMINDSSDYRFDAMPFGGAKFGGMGREGIRFAYEEMTQPKVVCLNLPQEAAAPVCP